MDWLVSLPPATFALAILVGLLAGTIKGMVGFAMPMIMISGLSTVMAPDLALAALILPTLMTNGVQALRQGWREAWASVRRYRVFLGVGFVLLVASAQLVAVLPQHVLFLMIGVPISLFAIMLLAGWSPKLANRSMRVEAGIGAFAGFVGGMSGVWGPPTVAYLTALDTPKQEQMRVQGVIYGLGAVALFGAHLQSGILSAATLPLSLFMIVPAMVGMWIGLRLHDRVDQSVFRKVTLVVLVVAGLNLVRRGLLG
ncbi:sulfite exporter TauE/SafE family protein [Pelagovum pacificum]|uniref:Probable membrane transporter protein n=1 Tax=Pelagovum pacificum TaxID=2588711 RepID=A0A5C5G9H8_9RHOB|nr:sulfite exporter TauE/SafE family protein [Pelagovum pacificum]QQA42310.1 sulfite exporter TauE/SafE family protein [Pelagovum pacificum]TNY31395.1 sulfite exporter TauE/SafE family protein [Pelagovum pacificum]